MARRPRGGRRDEIARAILEEFGVETADEAQEALRQILGPTIEAMLRAELDAHLGYASNDKSPKATANRRNGYTPKTVRTSAGELEISVPRDRDGSFEPVAVPKGSSDLSDVVSVNLFFTSWDCGGNPGPNRNRKEAACTALSRERSR